MISAEAVRAALERLPGDSTDTRFLAHRLDDQGRYRVAKTEAGSLVLVIAIEAPSGVVDIHLPNFRARVNALATIAEEGGPEVQQSVCVLEVKGRAADDRRVFASVASAVADALGPEGTPEALAEVLEALIDLFMPAHAPRGSLLGLWGELVVILSQAHPEDLVRAWHVDPRGLHDFVIEGRRLEVKTSQTGKREHQFSARQLVEDGKVSVDVVSVVTAPTDVGTTVTDLVEELDSVLVNSPELRMKVQRVVADTLGETWVEVVGAHAWDREYARASAQVFGASDLPAVDTSSPRVLSVRVVMDCTGLGVPFGNHWIAEV